jgi:hypothetical protein
LELFQSIGVGNQDYLNLHSRLIGFIGGGLAGLIAGTKYLDHVTNIFGKFALYLLFISIGSTVGEWLLSKIGQFVHDKVVFAPIKWLDSILGAAFELLKGAIVIFITFLINYCNPLEIR